MKIYWFRHDHENRNDLLRLGLIRAHYQKKILYREIDFSFAGDYGFSNRVLEYPDLRHKSLLLVEGNGISSRCLVDSEDSFVFLSSLIEEVDIYFCAGYNAEVFEQKKFVTPYKWQGDSDIAWYKETLCPKIDKYGEHFNKVKKFIPIAPSLSYPISNTWLKQKMRSAEYHVLKFFKQAYRFSDEYQSLETRHRLLLDLRKNELRYDVVLNDSLWGWPQHRVNLHLQLRKLQTKGHEIHSVLNKSDSEYTQDGLDLPLNTGNLERDYESMISQSRLGVFACGFHWGWRNIMMLSLMTGIPVLTDRLLTEAYFDMNEFTLWQIEDHSWKSIEEYLNRIDNENWSVIKRHNQEVYDKYLSPEAVAKYFIDTVSLSSTSWTSISLSV